MDDKFSIASIGVRGTPVICGFNTGQHSKQIFFHSPLLKNQGLFCNMKILILVNISNYL